jgi:hypothetical protein
MRRDKRLAYQGKIQALLKEWGSQIDRWQDRARADSQELIGDLNRKRQSVRSKLAAMKQETDERWQNRRPDVDRAVEEMREAVNTARDRFRQP